MKNELEQGFLDRFTRTDELIADELLPVLKKLQTGDIIVQPADTPDGTATLQDVLDALQGEAASAKIRTVPDDGNQAFTFGEGHNLIDFRRGYIKEGDGTVTKMKDSIVLGDSIKCMAIYATRDGVIDMGEGSGLTPIPSNVWVAFDDIDIEEFYYYHTSSTVIESDVTIIASTVAGGITAAPDPTLDRLNWVSIGTSGLYTAEIAQNAIAYEDIVIDGNAYEISHILFTSEANLNFRLWFFDKDDHPGKFMGYVDLDCTSYGARIGTGNYSMDVSGLAMKGIDGDYSKEMHIGLQNLSAIQKETTDNVTLEIFYKLLNDAAVI